ncbi:unnamed protein product [Polarella glacialis]|uniref:Uncharacterized protein n=1 Tax=Polarella glacialis TaxID=89957 RepID=A0A813H652_POLGL|nr:unnamed protein product [Polarella glacialis]
MAGHAGNLEAFADVAKGTNLLELVISLHRLDAASSGLKWKPPNPLDFAQPSGGADDGGGTAMPNPTDGIAKGWARLPEALPPESTQYSQEVLKGLLELAETCEGTTRLLQIHKRVSLDRLEKAVDFLGAARLLRNSNKVRPRSTFFAPTCDELAEPESPPEIGHDFEPWMRLANLVRQFGGASDFCDRAEAVDFRQLEAYIEILSVAGLTSKATNGDRDDDNDSDPCEISPELIRAWRDVVAVVAQNGGPKLFLDGFQGIDVVDFLQMVQLLRQAGLARSLDVNPPDTEPSILYIDGGADDSRVRNTKLQEFVDKVRQAGGFPAFWHALRRLDLSRVKGDLYCLGVIRKKLCEFVSEDLWHLIQDPDHLEEVLDRSLGGRRQEEGDLTITQRQSIMKRLKEVGGVEGFLKAFDKVSLSTLLEQHRALQEAGISSLSVIDSLAQIGALVQNQVDHLEGLRAVAATLVRWGNSHHYGEDPERLWKALHQQVSWLLAAIEENGALLRETSRHDKTSGHGKAKPQRKEPELTPARLAQFLQALRPMGGVQGFLAAFRGLDLATAAGQARVMHDSSVRSVETARRLAGIYRLIRGDPSHLRGLEHFLRGFGGPVFAEAQTQGNSHEDRLKVAERWQRLTDYMATASGRPGAAPFTELEAATSSGPDQALDVLLLGLRLSEAGGIRATSEEWLELCAEIKASHPPPDSTLRPSSAASTGALDTSGSLVTLHSGTGLTGILSRLRSTSSSSCSGRSKAQRLPSRGAPQPGRARPTSASSQPPLECQHCGARLADKTLPRGGSAGALDFSRALPSAALSWPSAVRGRSQLPIVDEVEDLIPENDDEFLQCAEKDSLVRMKRPASASRGRSEPAILRPLSAGALTSLAKSGPGLMRIDRSASPAPVAGPGWSPALGPRIVAAKSTF